MKTYLIAHDLTRPNLTDDYARLFKVIRSFGTFWHQLDDAWIVKADVNANTILEKLKPHLAPDDELLVVELSGRGSWHGFDANGSSWLKSNLSERIPNVVSERRIDDD